MKLILADFFEENREAIFKSWCDLFWSKFREGESYLRRGADPFENPFAYHIHEAFQKILEYLGKDFNIEDLDPYLDKLAQIRATQEPYLTKALYFLIDFKSLLREKWGDKITEEYGLAAWLEIEDLLDALLLRLGDFYLKYRERLLELKVEEWKRNNYLLLKRAGFFVEDREKH